MANTHALIRTGGIALILALGITAGPAAPYASAEDPPGNNGTVKIHDADTAIEDKRNEPQVCRFYVDGFGFDGSSSGDWWIQSWPPTGDRTEVLRADWTADASGEWHSSDQTLPDGHYKLFAKQQDELAPGGNKQKVFWVDCPSSGITPQASPEAVVTPSPTPTPEPSSTPIPGTGSVGVPPTLGISNSRILLRATTVPTVAATPLLGGLVIPANSMIILPSAIVLPNGVALAAGEIEPGTVLPAGTALPAGTTFRILGVTSAPISVPAAQGIGSLPATSTMGYRAP